MFKHNFKNSLKILFKNKPLLFWTFIFPIVLGTLFYMAFSNIENNEKLDVIDIGIVSSENENSLYDMAFKYLSNPDSEDRLFNITYGNLEEIEKIFNDDSIIGYLYFDDDSHVVVKKNGINETIFKNVVDEIRQYSLAMGEIYNYSYSTDITIEEYMSGLQELLNQEVNIKDTSRSNLSYTMIEFYSLIAMTCLYGALLSMYSLNQVLPNMTNKGKRVSVSPVSKGCLIVSSLCASIVAQLIGVLLLFLYLLFILNIDFGNNILLVILLTIVGSLAGLSLGSFVSAYFKGSEMSKIGIIISITMIFSFLSGMMGITMKYVIDKNIPIINKINPVNMITDGLYSLYYYDGFDRYIFNVVSLLIFSLIMIIISFIKLRRQRYEHI